MFVNEWQLCCLFAARWQYKTENYRFLLSTVLVDSFALFTAVLKHKTCCACKIEEKFKELN